MMSLAVAINICRSSFGRPCSISGYFITTLRVLHGSVEKIVASETSVNRVGADDMIPSNTPDLTYTRWASHLLAVGMDQ